MVINKCFIRQVQFWLEMSMATKECKNLSKKMREDVFNKIMDFEVDSNMNK